MDGFLLVTFDNQLIPKLDVIALHKKQIYLSWTNEGLEGANT